ncbi:MAG: hypothetical protein AB7K24_09805 [Gemmataceae bacterium]
MKTTGIALLIVSAAFVLGADEPKKEAALVIVDAAGKENKIKDYKILAGTRRLSWLVPAPKVDPKDKTKPLPPAGPEALEFREDNSTTFAAGIVTLVPLDRIQAIDYDNDPGQQLVTIKLTSTKPDEKIELKGTTRYRGVNKLVIEADVDKGDLGVAALKFQGGFKDNSIRGLRFAAPKAGAALEGKTATITAADKMSTKHEVVDLQALVRHPDGRLQTLPYLMFKKTLKVDLGKVKSIKFKDDPKTNEAEAEVALADGETLVLTALRVVPVDDKPTQLEGLVGKVPAGYKLFPLHTIAELNLGGN